LEKKRKLIYLSIGTIGISTGLLAIILLMNRNSKLREAEAEVEAESVAEPAKERWSKIEEDVGYLRNRFNVIKNFKI